MEINYVNGLTSIGKGLQPVEKWVAGKGRPQEEESAGQDKVDLSNHGRDIARQNNLIDDLINAVPDVRESRVDEMLFAIESGIYDAKAEQVAEKIMGGDLLDEII